MSDLVHIYVRPDATGFYATAAGRRLTPEPLDRDMAEAILRGAPNGSQWEIHPEDWRP